MNVNNLKNDISLRNPRMIVVVKNDNGDYVELTKIVEVKYDYKSKDIFHNLDSSGQPAIYLGEDDEV